MSLFCSDLSRAYIAIAKMGETYFDSKRIFDLNLSSRDQTATREKFFLKNLTIFPPVFLTGKMWIIHIIHCYIREFNSLMLSGDSLEAHDGLKISLTFC